MKLKPIFIALLCACNLLLAQKEANYWPMVRKYTLDFNQSIPPFTTGQSQIYSSFWGYGNEEGYSSICDYDGNLLIYSDGRGIYGKNHKLLPNGDNLAGDNSSTQNSIIIPQPGSDNYFVFMVGATEQGNKGLRYSLVDMGLNGKMGEVTSRDNVLHTNCTEKITAVMHKNCEDVWVMVKENNSNKYLCYLVSNGGISAPVVSYGAITTFTKKTFFGKDKGYFFGQMKFSPNGKWLSNAEGSGMVELGRFNNETGKLYDMQILEGNPTKPEYSFYGTEFSQDNKKLYYTVRAYRDEDINIAWELIQYNLDDCEIDKIKGSRNSIYSMNLPEPETGTKGGVQEAVCISGMQLAPDGKIYIGTDEHMSIIHKPNESGSACNFNPKEWAIFGRGLNCLPSTIQTYLLPNTIKYSGACPNNPIDFCLINYKDITSISWDFGDPASGSANTSTDLRPKHTFSSVGKYTITLTLVRDGKNVVITEELDITKQSLDLDLGPDLVICENEWRKVEVPKTACTTLQWFDGSNEQYFNFQKAGTYTAELSNENGCTVKDTINVTNLPAPLIDPDSNFVICEEDYITITNINVDASKYDWSTGHDTRAVNIDNSGDYSVIVEFRNGCKRYQGYHVKNCPINSPNTFTPNDDGVNDFWTIEHLDIYEENEVTVYNRNGNVVFYAKNYTSDWKGTFRGKPLPETTYYYTIDLGDGSKLVKGTITILR